MQAPAFATDLSRLPTHAFGNRSVTWWGIVAFFLISGVAIVSTNQMARDAYPAVRGWVRARTGV